MKKPVWIFTSRHLVVLLLVVVSLVLLPSLLAKAQGQAGTSLTASKTAEGQCGHVVRGEITVTNTGERATEGLMIVDIVQYKNGAGQFQDALPTFTIVLESDGIVLEPGETRVFTYEINCNLPELKEEGVLMRNVAHVTITNHSGHLWERFGPSPKADFYFE
jgi:hypothetical protein